MKQVIERLRKLADEAIKEYNEEHVAGGEAVYPAWADDVLYLLKCVDAIGAGGVDGRRITATPSNASAKITGRSQAYLDRHLDPDEHELFISWAREKHGYPDYARLVLDSEWCQGAVAGWQGATDDRKRRGEPVAWIYEDDLPKGYPYDEMYPFSKVDGVRMFPVFWPETVLTPGYLEGHRDGLEWAARLAEANHPLTGDWLYDDPHDLAKAIRKGPEMPPAEPQPAEPVKDGQVGEMTPKRAAFFLERFKREEKMLGPNEQRALDYAIEVLEAEPVKVSDEVHQRVRAFLDKWERMSGNDPDVIHAINGYEYELRVCDLRALLARYGSKS